MGLTSRGRRDPNVRWVAFALAGGVPLAAYLATASAHGYWLDGGELTAQAIHLDIAHPPGHPLAGLVGKLFTLLPFGPLPFRVAVGQAVCAAVAAGFLFSALETTVRALGVLHDRVAVPLALGGTWLVACSVGWWFQAVRPEVYALQALLVMVAIERVIALEAAWPTHDVRPLYVAALALGLSLANHHLVGFLAMPAIAPTLARVYRAKGLRPLLIASGALALGLATYVYLPLRASAGPPANLGDPDSFARLYWVVSAQVYAHDMGLEAVQPLGERFLDLLAILGTNIGGFIGGEDPLVMAVRSLLVITLAALGLYAILRTPGARRIGVTWGLLFAVNLGARAWLGSVRSNPDILGYIMPGLAATAALIVALPAAFLGRASRPQKKPSALATVVAGAVALLGLAQLHASAPNASLASFHATDDFDEERVRRLPTRAVVVAHRPQTVFRHWSVAATEGARPDVTIVPMPFLEYPGVLEALIERDPDIAGLLRGYLIEGELRQPDLQSLAMRRPLLLEQDVRVPIELYETLVPAGLYYEVVDSGATDTDVLEASRPHAEVLNRLYAHLGDAAEEDETLGHLLWIHYTDALYFASIGALDPALEATRKGLRLSPQSPELQALAEAIVAADGPVNVAPFIVGRSRER